MKAMTQMVTVKSANELSSYGSVLTQDASPRCPTSHSVAGNMSCIFKETKEKEPAGNGRIECAQDDDGWNHERERNDLVVVL